MTDKTDYIISENEWAMTPVVADALRAEIARIEVRNAELVNENVALRARITEQRDTINTAVADADGALINKLRARIAELEAQNSALLDGDYCSVCGMKHMKYGHAECCPAAHPPMEAA